MVTMQYDADVVPQIVAPATAATMDFVYPIPVPATATEIRLARLAAGCGFNTASSYTVGALLTLSGRWGHHGLASLNSLEMWFDYICGEGGIDQAGSMMNLVVQVVDVSAGTDAVTAGATMLANGTYGDVNVMVAPYSSTYTPYAAAVASSANIPIVAAQAAASSVYQCADNSSTGCAGKAIGSRRFETLFGVLAPAEAYLDGSLELFAAAGATRVAIVLESTKSFSRATCAGARELAAELGMTVVYNYSIGAEALEVDEASTIVTEITAANVDAVLGCTYFGTAVTMLRGYAAANQTLPDAVALVGLVTSTTAENADVMAAGNLAYVTGPITWVSSLAGPGYNTPAGAAQFNMYPYSGGSGMSSPMQFNAAYTDRWGSEPVPQAAAYIGALYTVANAMTAAAGATPAAITSALLQTNISTPFGQVNFSASGQDLNKAMVTMQYDAEVVPQIVAPATAATMDFVYPIPVPLMTTTIPALPGLAAAGPAAAGPGRSTRLK